MNGQTTKNRFQSIKAAGSVMEIWPHGGYNDYMPDSTMGISIKEYWGNVAFYLNRAILLNELEKQAGGRVDLDEQRR